MKEEWELAQEAAEARTGADRMAMGLSCNPHPIRGDMDNILCMNQYIEDKNKEVLRLKEQKIPEMERKIARLEEDIQFYIGTIVQLTQAIIKYEELITKMRQWLQGAEMEKDIIHRDVIPKCQFQSDFCSTCNKTVSRISFGIPCCEEHAQERDKSLK